MFGRSLFLHVRMLKNKMPAVALCISVSDGHAISEMAKIVRVTGDCSLREVFVAGGWIR